MEQEHLQTKNREFITKKTCCSKEIQEEAEEMMQDLKILQDQVAKMESKVAT